MLTMILIGNKRENVELVLDLLVFQQSLEHVPANKARRAANCNLFLWRQV
jgi:hypothetical protein